MENIFPDADAVKPVDRDAKIVRYMRLPAFFMLLQGRVFIPTLEKLAKSDPYESKVPMYCSPTYDLVFGDLLDDESWNWLLERALDWERKQIELNGEEYARYSNPILLNIWLRELGKQRLVWCWHANTRESMGLWNNYGHHGVAIVSSISRICRSLTIDAPIRTSVGFVRYINKNASRQDAESLASTWLTRPYYWKLDSYEFEHELRFVCECDPTHGSGGGIELKANANELIEEVIYSPHLFHSEAKAIAKFVGSHTNHNQKWRQRISDLLSPDENSDTSFDMLLEAMNKHFSEQWDQDTHASQLERPAKLFDPV
jgi:hypothetical protein